MNSFLELAKERYSVRSYKTTPVEDEKIALILEAAKCAPTACNNQPQKIYVVKSEEKRKALAAASPCTFDAPLIFVIGFDGNVSAKGKIEDNYDLGDIDASIITTHMMLEAAELGLGTCWVGYFNSDEVAKVLGIPENIHIRALLPTGYAADDAVPSPLHSSFRPAEELIEEL